jgi:hypothetical protein
MLFYFQHDQIADTHPASYLMGTESPFPEVKPLQPTDNFQITPWRSVRMRTLPTEPAPLVGEFLRKLLQTEGCRVVGAAEHPWL